MTISASAIDQGFGHETHRITFAGIFASTNQQSAAGRVALTVHNHSARFRERLIERLLLQHDGFGLAIGGAIHEAGVPVVRRVRLYRRSDGQFVGETLSNADGDYRIGNMPADVLHYAIALDDLGTDPNFNALILDQLVGGEVEPLPEPFDIEVRSPTIPMEWGGTAGHLHWRFTNFVDAGSGAGVEFSEIEPYESGVSLLASATVTGTAITGTNPGGGTVQWGADGALSTEIYWNAAACSGGAFLRFSFAAPVTFTHARMGVLNNFPTYWVSAMDLQYSDDGSTWTTKGTVIPAGFPGVNSYTAQFALP